jgi:hypothetical protein
MFIKAQFRCAAVTPGAVGIVVNNAQRATPPPRAAAFVWGMGVFRSPSLPFGRWKSGQPQR